MKIVILSLITLLFANPSFAKDFSKKSLSSAFVKIRKASNSKNISQQKYSLRLVKAIATESDQKLEDITDLYIELLNTMNNNVYSTNKVVQSLVSSETQISDVHVLKSLAVLATTLRNYTKFQHKVLEDSASSILKASIVDSSIKSAIDVFMDLVPSIIEVHEGNTFYQEYKTTADTESDVKNLLLVYKDIYEIN